MFYYGNGNCKRIGVVMDWMKVSREEEEHRALYNPIPSQVQREQ